MNNLFNLDNLTNEEIINLLNKADEFAKGKSSTAGNGKVVANLFFEPSTRTHYSFDIAANRLGARTINFNASTSSAKKGESLYDTVKTFEAMGVDAMVIRHPENEYYKQLENIKTPILSGGDGTGNHPTQSLLDLLTIYQEFETFEGINITIVGDIKHSRVAATNIKVMKKLGMNVSISGPIEFMIEAENQITIDEAVKESDVIMLLRVQHERHEGNMKALKEEYNNQFGLNKARVENMKDNAIVMHPAPFNRGVEIDDWTVECNKARIFKQIKNGVAVRQMLLEEVL